jgi:hypothetical protein
MTGATIDDKGSRFHFLRALSPHYQPKNAGKDERACRDQLPLGAWGVLGERL